MVLILTGNSRWENAGHRRGSLCINSIIIRVDQPFIANVSHHFSHFVSFRIHLEYFLLSSLVIVIMLYVAVWLWII